MRRATAPAARTLIPGGISIHALLAESDGPWPAAWRLFSDFYPRSPCGERPTTFPKLCTNMRISIHALLAESDPAGRAVLFNFLAFLSTLSLRRATEKPRQTRTDTSISIHALLAESDAHPVGVFVSVIEISIHALLAESDRRAFYDIVRHTYFYPRSPCGERRGWTLNINGPMAFLSTLSLRRATSAAWTELLILFISIHALLAESDVSAEL